MAGRVASSFCPRCGRAMAGPGFVVRSDILAKNAVYEVSLNGVNGITLHCSPGDYARFFVPATMWDRLGSGGCG